MVGFLLVTLWFHIHDIPEMKKIHWGMFFATMISDPDRSLIAKPHVTPFLWLRLPSMMSSKAKTNWSFGTRDPQSNSHHNLLRCHVA